MARNEDNYSKKSTPKSPTVSARETLKLYKKLDKQHRYYLTKRSLRDHLRKYGSKQLVPNEVQTVYDDGIAITLGAILKGGEHNGN